ncbi:MAG: alanine--tRNA ligase [Candidatus Saccharibacteria bacterium]|nr:alanine--tRNA ligase [Candidatus Saccharibacteria bacterium]
MNAQEIRNAYLQFYKERGHAVVQRAPLVLTGDPTTLFTGSGMQPMISYLLGEATHPEGDRIADSQTCLRAQDIDDIGDNRHTTFFEMLGNWSMGDYFKEQQIRWMWEFLSEVVKLDMSRVYVTCYIGDERYNIPKDTEAAAVWAELYEQAGLSYGQADIGSEEDGYRRGIRPGEQIFYYDGSKNWWSRNGGPETTPIGDPCGPDSEMFYDFGTPHDPAYGEHCHPNCDCGRFMEIGNNVFMAYKKVADGVFEELEQKNIDHGSGLERIAAAKLGDPDVFKISLMWPIIEKLQELSGKKYEDNLESMRVIADHLRAATFLAVDGCTPSNKEQGYVMRRLLRRAIRFATELGIKEEFFEEIVPVIADLYAADFPEVAEQRDKIIITLMKEEKAFTRTLIKGVKHLRKFAENGLSGAELFTLHDTYGFPVELSTEIARREGVKLDPDWRAQFNARMEEQRQRSQTAAKGTFKGGLEGQTMAHRRLHTANHLMYAALRKVVGDHIMQRGSNITAERLRFDFNNDGKVTREQLDEVERLVNDWIAADLPVSYQEYPTDEAFKMGAIGAFGDRYGDTVKVYQMGAGEARASFEICGGPHVDHTAQLAQDDDGTPNGKQFKILKEESSSAGVRRVKAVLQ